LTHVVRAIMSTAAAIIVASLIIVVLQQVAGVPNASAVYVLAVAVVALFAGRTGAVIASVGSFLTYDFFFIEPLFTFTVRDPGEWLNLTLLLVIGLLVGQLAALLRARADDARAREREARALFVISRELATRPSTTDALARIAAAIRANGGFDRAWFTAELSPTGAPTASPRQRPIADTAPGTPLPEPTGYLLLRRTPGDAPARWDTIHTATVRATRAAVPPTRPATGDAERVRPDRRHAVLRIAMEAGGRTSGSLWATRRRALGLPSAAETRLVASAADQVAQALEQDRLATEAREAEIARRSDALKTALLESVSHDLRTPLASIRAAAGSLTDRDLHLTEADRIASAQAIDREAERLNHLVTNLLDMSRIEGGALRVDREIYDLRDVVEATVPRVRPVLGGRPLEIAIGDLPPVEVDAVFFDRILVNLLENTARHTPPDAPIRISGHASDGGRTVRLTVEDGGPGVAAEALPRLFEKFYRAPGPAARAKSGTGIGLSVVRGLAEAMGGTVAARRGELGGLAVDVELAAAPVGMPE
jgi:two-component system, OmpR family, sensor histidine kinase KdpD